ncbi:MAG: phosphoglycerate kinase [Candidatus Kerfeldbacteria bacterium]|nr:phosphoglycerate kinase [Candidatus Kerfeldbacteria bacterium]
MKLRSFRSLNVRGKRVLVRAGFNVPTNARGHVQDDWRLERGLPTLQALLQQRASLVVMTHRGRPQGRPSRALSVRGIATALGRRLRRPVRFLPSLMGPAVARAVAQLKPGQVAMLENLRFAPEEERNDAHFARQLAALGDVYVDDAFENAHRRHASMVAITRYLPSAAGRLLEEEVATLEQALHKPKRPLVTIIGGAKISTKIRLITTLLRHVDYLLLGGALANAVLREKGIQIGRSFVEPNLGRIVRSIPIENPKLKIPIDVIAAASPRRGAASHRRAAGSVGAREFIYDIGPDTLELYGAVIRSAGTVIWNGPMGLIEQPTYSRGTRAIARAIAATRCHSILGGGETIQAVRAARLIRRFSFVSTGGGAMLEFLERRTLPALRALQR